ncbi:MAG: pantoate--beta-alanine ligase [Spirochaetota bacterium]|nr:pantoate--beta-alanine ligase [Spirochaetota bacterium]
METIITPGDMQNISLELRRNGVSLGFVPTMGALHDGHLSLIRESLAENDKSIVSIFVNPTQFGPTEDLGRYPRTIEKDMDKLRGLGVDYLFLPTNETMYPAGFRSYVTVEGLTDKLCGLARPEHFRGVTTVCCKLFQIVSPRISYFGQKDYQQALVIRRMIEDLNIPMELKVMPITREEDGLAMSSRNRYLSSQERKDALVLYQSLLLAYDMLQSGKRDASSIKSSMEKHIRSVKSSKIDYISICDTESLEEIDGTVDQKALAAVAVFIGSCRLIDNRILKL